MAATYKDNGGSVDGSNKVFTYDFPVLQTEDIKVALNGVTQATTKYTPSLSPANITFNNTDVDSTVQESTGAPKSGVTVRVYRETTVGTNTGNEDPKVVFAAGSSIRAGDLNSNTEQALFGIHEQQEKLILTENINNGAVTSAKIEDGTIVNDDISATAEIAVNKLAHGSNNQILQSDNSGNVVWETNVQLPGNLDVNTNTTVGGTLGVTGTTTAAAINASGAVNIDGNLAINTDKFNVQSASGDTTISGTLGVTGNASFTQVLGNGAHIDNIYIGINDANEIDTASGNLTLDSAGGTVVVDDDLSVTGTITGTLGTNVVPSAAIQDEAVTYAKMQHVSATSKVLGRISSGAGDVEELSAANIKTIYESNAETNAYTDAHNTLVGGINASASEINSLYGFTGDKDDLNITTGMTKALSSSAFPTTSDTAYPTAKAVNAHIVDIVNDVGGFVPVAIKSHLPNTHPDPENSSGTIISIANATGLRIADGSGSGDYAGTAGHSVSATTYNAQLLNGTVATITGFPSSLQGTQLSTKGLLIQTTAQSDSDYASAPVFTYHRLTLDEGGVASAQSAITDFNERYRTDLNDPGSDNDEGDLFFNKTSNTMKVYDGSAWKEVTSAGDFKYLFLCPFNGTGAPTLDGNIAKYDLREGSNAGTGASVTKAAQLIVSINGVVQKANTGTSAPAEGFALVDSNTIIFGTNLASDDSVFIVQVGSAVALNHPAEDSVVAASIDDGAILNAAINTNANIEASKLDNPLQFPDNHKISFGTDGTGDLEIYHVNAGHSYIKDTGASHLRLENDNIRMRNGAGDELMFTATVNDSVGLYYNGVKTIETNANGITVYGAADSDGYINLYADSGDDDPDKWRIAANASASRLRIQNYHDGSWETNIEANSNGAVKLDYNNSTKLETTDTGVTVTANLVTTGNCSPSADGGGNLGSTDYSWYNLYINNDIWVADAGKLILGDDSDLQISNNTNSLIKHEGTGDLYIDAYSKDIYIRSGDGSTSVENAISCIDNAQVELYHSGTKKFETASSGVQIHGNAIYPDGAGPVMGASSDLQIYHDSGSINRISLLSDGYLVISQGGTNAFSQFGNGSVFWTKHHFVWADDSYNLGSSTERWDNIYATNGTIQTSDRNEKNTIVDSDLGLSFVNKLKPVSYKFNGKTRTHYGLIAQDIETTLSDISKSTTDFAGFIKNDLPDILYDEIRDGEAITNGKKVGDVKTPAHTSYGVRYHEFIAPLIKAVQELSAEVETLKTKVATLEAK